MARGCAAPADKLAVRLERKRRGLRRGFAPLAFALRSRQIRRLAMARETPYAERALAALVRRKPTRVGRRWVLR